MATRDPLAVRHSPATLAWAWCRRHPLGALAVATLAVQFLAAFAGSTVAVWSLAASVVVVGVFGAGWSVRDRAARREEARHAAFRTGVDEITAAQRGIIAGQRAQWQRMADR